MKIGIVGAEAAKFTSGSERMAREYIRAILSQPGAILVSGHCHLGGIDIWAEQEASKLDMPMIIFPPKRRSWNGGYKPRNLQIAETSDVVHCIAVDSYPSDYKGMRFDMCYHCGSSDHVKSGGCWTVKQAVAMGKIGHLWIVNNLVSHA